MKSLIHSNPCPRRSPHSLCRPVTSGDTSAVPAMGHMLFLSAEKWQKSALRTTKERRGSWMRHDLPFAAGKRGFRPKKWRRGSWEGALMTLAAWKRAQRRGREGIGRRCRKGKPVQRAEVQLFSAPDGEAIVSGRRCSYSRPGVRKAFALSLPQPPAGK